MNFNELIEEEKAHQRENNITTLRNEINKSWVEEKLNNFLERYKYSNLGTVEELKNADGITNNMLTIRQELIIPVSVPSDSTNTTTYIVKRGDSLWLIANKYNTTVDNLKSLNNLSNNT